MRECAGCGNDKVKLFEAVSDKGIVLVCDRCVHEAGLLVIKKPVAMPKEEPKFREAVKNFEKYSRPFVPEDVHLKDLVEKNFRRKLPQKKEKRHDLIDNFHWIIMRARRSKKISVAQLAQAIGESEMAIKMAEQGILPEVGDYKLVNKLEAYLRIVLMKDRSKVVDYSIQPFVEKKGLTETIEFDPFSTRTITISDLRELKKKQDKDVLEVPEKAWQRPETVEEMEARIRNTLKEDGISIKDRLKGSKKDFDNSFEEEKIERGKNELSSDEIDDLIFGRKRD